jgi:thiol-disulfide isomerase/thioredoxin
MKNFFVLAFLFVIAGQTLSYSQSQTYIPIYNFNEFEHFLHFHNDTVYVVHFWATWCVPCRKELPEFEKINLKYFDRKVKVLLVSLDFPAQIEKKLTPFLKNNHISAEVLLLNDPKSNAWIDKVDTSWSGSIPATLIYKNNRRNFFEKELEKESLSSVINEYINQ